MAYIPKWVFDGFTDIVCIPQFSLGNSVIAGGFSIILYLNGSQLTSQRTNYNYVRAIYSLWKNQLYLLYYLYFQSAHYNGLSICTQISYQNLQVYLKGIYFHARDEEF